MFNGECQRISIERGELLFWPNWLSDMVADKLQQTLRKRVTWLRPAIRIAGHSIPIPRLNALYGDEGRRYAYSGIHLPVNQWLPELEALRQQVNEVGDSHLDAVPGGDHRLFNSALLNLYRSGRDSVDWHSDDEPELGDQPVIATVSLGASRRFDLRPRHRPGADGDRPLTHRGRQTMHLDLPHGSLLIMAGDMQRYWQHRVAKINAQVGERISITFRWVDDGAVANTMVGSGL